ncbi:hypothetical protein WDU94_006366 [Cyamophila willieti]
MACLLLTCLLLGCVYFVKPNECPQHLKKLLAEVKNGNDIAARHEDCLHRARRDAKQENEKEMKEKLAEKMEQLRQKKGALKSYKSNLEFRQKLVQQYYTLRKQGEFESARLLADKMNKTNAFHQNYLNFQKMLVDAAKNKKNITLGPEYRIYVEHREKIIKYMKKLKEEGVSQSIAFAKIADKMHEYWFKHVESLQRTRRDISEENRAHSVFREKMLEHIKVLDKEENFDEVESLLEKMNKTYELQEKYFTFRDMQEKGMNVTQFQNQRKIYDDLSERIEKYKKACKAKGFPKHVIEDKLADKINEYWFKQVQALHRTRRDTRKGNQTEREFRKNMIELVKNLTKQGKVEELKKVYVQLMEAYNMKEKFADLQNVLAEAGDKGMLIDQGPEFRRYMLGTKRILHYMETFKGNGFPKHVKEDKVEDRMNKSLHRKRRDTKEQNHTVSEFRDKLVEHMKKLDAQGNISELTKLSRKIMKINELQKKYLDFHIMAAEAAKKGENVTQGPEYKTQMEHTMNILEYIKNYTKTLKGLSEQVREDKLSDKMYEYWFKHVESLHRVKRDGKKQNYTRIELEFRDKIVEQMKQLSNEGNSDELTKLAQKVIKTYDLQEKYLEFHKKLAEAAKKGENVTRGPEYERNMEHTRNVLEYVKKFKKNLTDLGLPKQVIEDKVTDKMHEYWFKHVESSDGVKSYVNKQNYTRIELEFRDKITEQMKQLNNNGNSDELTKLTAKLMKTYDLQQKYLEFQHMLAEAAKKGENVTRGPEYERNMEHTRNILEYVKEFKKNLTGLPKKVIVDKIADKMHEYWFKRLDSSHRVKRDAKKQNNTRIELEFRDKMVEHMKQLSDQGYLDELQKLSGKVMKTYDLQQKYLEFQHMLAEAAKKGENVTRGPEYERNMKHTRNILEYVKEFKKNLTDLPKGLKVEKVADKMHEYWFKHLVSSHRVKRDAKEQYYTKIELEFRDKIAEHMKHLSNQGNFDELQKFSEKVKKTYDLQRKYLEFQQMLAEAAKKGENVTKGPEYERNMEHTRNIFEIVKELKKNLTGLPKKVLVQKVADKMHEYWFKHLESSHRVKRDANKQNDTRIELGFKDKIAEQMKHLSNQGNFDELQKISEKVKKTYDLHEKYLKYQYNLAQAVQKGENITQGPEYDRNMEHTRNIHRSVQELREKLTGLPEEVQAEKILDRMHEYWFKHVESSHRVKRDANKQNDTRIELRFKDKIAEQMKQLSNQGNFDELQKISEKVKKTYDLHEKYLKYHYNLSQAVQKGETITQGPEYDRNMEHTRNIHIIVQLLREKLTGLPEEVQAEKILDRMHEYWFKHVESSHRVKRDANKQNQTVFEFRDKLAAQIKKLQDEGNYDQVRLLSAKVLKASKLAEEYFLFQKKLEETGKNREIDSNATSTHEFESNMEHTKNINEIIQNLKGINGSSRQETNDKIEDKMNEYWFQQAESLFRKKRDIHERNHTALGFRDKLVEQMKKLQNQGKVSELRNLYEKIEKTYELQQQYIAFQKKLAESVKKGENVTQGPEFKRQLEHSKNIVECMKELKGKGIPEHKVQDVVEEIMTKYWFKQAGILFRKRREINEQNHTLEFRDRLVEQMEKLRNQGNVNELEKLSENINKTNELQKQYIAFQKMLVESNKRGERVTQGPEFKRQMEHTKNFVKYVEELKGKGFPEHILNDKLQDKMNEYWFKQINVTNLIK